MPQPTPTLHAPTSPGAGRLLTGFTPTTGIPLRDAILIAAISAAPRAARESVEELGRNRKLSPEAAELIGKLIAAMVAAPDSPISDLLHATGRVTEEQIVIAVDVGVVRNVEAVRRPR